jgi:hypothetical protein
VKTFDTTIDIKGTPTDLTSTIRWDEEGDFIITKVWRASDRTQKDILPDLTENEIDSLTESLDAVLDSESNDDDEGDSYDPPDEEEKE